MVAFTRNQLSTAEARDRLAELVNRAAYGKERLILTRRGKALVAIVPVEDLELIEAAEDDRDAALIRERLAAWEAAGRPGIPLEDYVRERGLDISGTDD